MFTFFKKLAAKARPDSGDTNTKALKDMFYGFAEMAIKDYINEVIIPESKKQLTTEFERGSVVVVNKYNLKHDSSNGWDMGSRAITMCLTNPEDKFKIQFATVTEVRYQRGILDDKATQFVRDLPFDPSITKDDLIEKFKIFLTNSNKFQITNYNYIYIDVFFELKDFKFRPQWGLNANSFLLVNSEEGKKTIQAWENEIRMEIIRLDSKRRTEELLKENVKLIPNYLKVK